MKFWSLSKNKTSLQQLFIKWVVTKCHKNFDKDVFLGGAHKDDPDQCISIKCSTISDERLLRCSHEEADDRLFYHLNHAARVENYNSVIVASTDTDIFVSSIYHYSKLKDCGLQNFWLTSGRGESRSFFPVHSLYEQLPTNVADVLPAVHALTGCNTVSKVGTKSRALKASFDHYNLIQDFGKAALSEDMMISAEKFLLRSICTNQHVSTFDDLGVEIYHKNSLKFDIKRFPPSSNAVRVHIKRAYIQCYIWINASNIETIQLDPINYGYRLNNRDLEPVIISKPPIPNDFPEPCKCKVCSRRTVCR